MRLIRVYPNVVLDQPLQLVSPPDGTGPLFVVEKTGRIRILPADPRARALRCFSTCGGRNRPEFWRHG